MASKDGAFFQLSNDVFWNTDGDINDRDEVAWVSRNYPESDIRYLRRNDLGDLNCDGDLNNFDIDAFVMTLAEPDAYTANYPDCDRMLADINEDGFVNNFDIDSFVALLMH